MALVHGADASNILRPLLLDAAGRPRVVVDSIGTVSVVGAVDATLVSPLTAGGAVKVDQQTLPVPVSDNSGSLTVDFTTPVTVISTGADKLFGIESVVEEQVVNLNAAAGVNMLVGTAVPSGKIHVITAISAADDTSAASRIKLLATGLASTLVLLDEAAKGAGAWTTWTGVAILQAGDHIDAVLTGCTLNDDLYLRYAGYAMDAP